MNGGSSAPYLARTPCVPLFSTLFNREWEKQKGFQTTRGGRGSYFHCKVEPSPGHIRCRVMIAAGMVLGGDQRKVNRVFGEGVKSARGETAIPRCGDHTRNMFGSGKPRVRLSCTVGLPSRSALLIVSRRGFLSFDLVDKSTV